MKRIVLNECVFPQTQCVATLAMACLMFSTTVGCLPATSEGKVAKPRSTKEAVGRWNSVRGSRGQSSTSTYSINGEEFEALWEITRSIGGKAKLQLKLPAEWDDKKVYLAVQKAFTEEKEQPWFYPAEDTFLSLLRRAMSQIDRENGEDSGSSIGVTPDMPYDCRAKVIQRDNEWFIELTATLIAGMDGTPSE